MVGKPIYGDLVAVMPVSDRRDAVVHRDIVIDSFFAHGGGHFVGKFSKLGVVVRACQLNVPAEERRFEPAENAAVFPAGFKRLANQVVHIERCLHGTSRNRPLRAVGKRLLIGDLLFDVRVGIGRLRILQVLL